MRNILLYVLIQRIYAQLLILNEEEINFRRRRAADKIKTGKDD